MPHALPEDPFQRALSSKDGLGTAIPYRPSHYNIPCRHGPGCKLFEMGECHFYHEPGSPPLRLEGMKDGLSDPVVLSAFDSVDTTFQWYSVQNVETLASFNVLKDGRLAVPGVSLRLFRSPVGSQLTELGLPPVLRRPESDIFFSKSDHYLRFPPRPEFPKFDPFLRALDVLRPDLDPSSLSVVTTAGCLRRITDFLSHGRRTERLDLEFRHGALFLGRWEGDSALHTYIGYGKQFEEEVQRYSPGLKGSVSSHIVARYEMGGLKLGVQVEVDAFECKCHSHAKALSNREVPRANRRLSGGRFDALADAPGEGEVDDGVLRVGTQLPLSCAVEIKTRGRNAKGPGPFAQLYFQQTPRVFLAIRDGQQFQRGSMGMLDERNELQVWEAKNQALLGRVAALLKRLRREAERRAGDDGVCKLGLVLEGGGNGRAILYAREGEDLVSDI